MLELVLASGVAGVLPRYISRRRLLVICFSACFTGQVTGSSLTLDTLGSRPRIVRVCHPWHCCARLFNLAVPRTKRSRFKVSVRCRLKGLSQQTSTTRSRTLATTCPSLGSDEILIPGSDGGAAVCFSPFTPHYRGFCLTFWKELSQSNVTSTRLRCVLLVTRSFPYKETSTKSSGPVVTFSGAFYHVGDFLCLLFKHSGVFGGNYALVILPSLHCCLSL